MQRLWAYGVIRGLKGADRVLTKLRHIAGRKTLACVIVAGVALTLRVAVLPLIPPPVPVIHDEFAYLLGAETFATGRLALPTPPFWVHFETLHENFVPTYASKYPPLQSLFLALGFKVFGNPWFGVWLSFGIMCAALCWMLQGWMPPIWAFLGTLVCIAQLGITGYWMDSYWGGAATAAAGCLVLGAVPRLARNPTTASSFWGSLGLLMLANARPFEGLCTAVVAGIVLLWWRQRISKPAGVFLTGGVVVPFVVIVAVGALWMGFYNHSTTGHVLEFPYTVYNSQYAVSPQFYLLPERPRPWPEYHHDVLRQYWLQWCRDQWVASRHNPLAVVPGFLRSMSFFYSFWFALLVGASAGALTSPKLRRAIAILVVLLIILLLEVGIQPHYLAPAVGTLAIMAAHGLRWLHVRARRSGAAIVLVLVLLTWKRDAVAILDASRDHRLARLPDANLSAANLVRPQVLQRLTRREGRHVVIVTYAPTHDVGKDFDVVYNHANIEASDVIWARDMGAAKNRELIDSYPDRECWLLNPDAKPWSLTPCPLITR
jgi:hypothetical protein